VQRQAMLQGLEWIGLDPANVDPVRVQLVQSVAWLKERKKEVAIALVVAILVTSIIIFSSK
jgi:hypothetical protein